MLITFIQCREFCLPISRQLHSSFITDLTSTAGLARPANLGKFNSSDGIATFYAHYIHGRLFPGHEIVPKFRYLHQSRSSDAGGVIYQATTFLFL